MKISKADKNISAWIGITFWTLFIASISTITELEYMFTPLFCLIMAMICMGLTLFTETKE